MPRAGLSAAAVVEAALPWLTHKGTVRSPSPLSRSGPGVATPSLYKHVAGLGELRTLLGVRVLEDMAERFTHAVLGCSGDDAVTTLMHAYRAYVKEHPARYAA